MTTTLYWLQGGGCGGDTWSFLGAESPNVIELFQQHDIEVLWHPSLSNSGFEALEDLHRRIITGRQKLDLLCIEGAALRGPSETGGCDMLAGRPKIALIRELAACAGHVLAIGTCAAFGGIGGDTVADPCGLQYDRTEKGGILGTAFKSGSGLPVINLPGCPCHCDIIGGTLSALLSGIPLEFGEYHTPTAWYGMLVHQGCTRNEYHEYRVEETQFGEKGCLFFYMGCHGPLAYGSCNKILWNRRSSKTRVGVPCFGCTRPDFPMLYPFFETRNIEGIPIDLPAGVSRAHYLAYKGMAAAAAPPRLIHRKSGV